MELLAWQAAIVTHLHSSFSTPCGLLEAVPVHPFPPRAPRGFPFLSSAMRVLSAFVTVVLTGGRSYPLVLVCISLMIPEAEHLFMHLLAVCMSSSEECLVTASAHLKIRWLGYFGY